MGAWSGPFLIAALVLAVAGVAKAADPTMTVGALRGLRVAVPPVVVRIAGAAEAALAVMAAVTGAPALALAVSVSYLGFTAFVVVALVRRVPIGSCGCFGRAETPPSIVHVVVNLAAAASGLGVAVGHRGGFGSVVADQPLAGIPFLGLTMVGVYAVFTALTVVPQLAQARGRTERGRTERRRIERGR